jgi:two-component system, cell cycle response regulator
MSLRILIIESEPDDVLFLQDVLTEIHWTNWVQTEILYATSWSAAAAILARQAVDVILLGLDPADTFRRIQSVAERIPVVLLLASEDDGAIRMLRDGAQDFLIKGQVDCEPLAHAIRNAIERHKLLTATRAGRTTDSLTGVPGCGSFLALADRDRKIAERLDRRLMVIVAEPDHVLARDDRDLIVMEAADHLRCMSHATDLLGRISETRFAVTVFETESESLEDVWARMHSGAAGVHLRIGAAIFDPQRPVPLESLLQQAALDLAPVAIAVRR